MIIEDFPYCEFLSPNFKKDIPGCGIVLNPKLRLIRIISTGLGTQEILTDEICERILQNIILPEFKNEDFYNGLDKGTMNL